MLRNKRLTVATLFTILIASVFWTQSRAPALNEKAQMGLRTDFSSIAFDILLPVSSEQPILERVARSTVNWAYTNWKGMTFGLLFAAAALTILGSVRRRSFRQPWLNTLAGVLVGAPLGVCVNCATPIAQGLYSAGARLEAALASLISSPTLNVIVLSMAFTLLPWELALGKLIGVFLVIAAIPMLVRRFASEPDPTDTGSVSAHFSKTGPVVDAPPSSEESGRADDYPAVLIQTAHAFLRNLLYITRVALPLMLLAGALGALAIELVPFDFFSRAEPTFFLLLAAALIATVLPVPIAFDVIIVMALLTSGINIGIAAALLFALGIFSIYPAFVIARHISARLSAAMVVSVWTLAVLIGLATDGYFERRALGERQLIAQGLAQGGEDAYQEAIGVCDAVPDALQTRCFSQRIQALNELMSYGRMCTTRPRAVDEAACESAVNAHLVEVRAPDTFTIEECAELTEPDLRARCGLTLAYRAALRNHDIEACAALQDPSLVQSCRIQFLNASLLFNPDETVCRNLQGQELSDCRVNAAIYRLADTLDFGGCDGFAAQDAREHCRYTIASNMIGRTNDSRGCAQIQTPELADRCRSLVRAWEASREGSLELCSTLAAESLRDTCYLRVAGARIDAIVTNHTLGLSAERVRAESVVQTGIAVPAGPPADAPPMEWASLFESGGTVIETAPYRASLVPPDSMPFERLAGSELGIERSWSFRQTDFFEPFIIGKGIASGDIDNDLWPDIVLASERGALIYKNVGGRFQLLDVEQGELADANLFLVAFVDADNDGAQDLFATAYGGANYLLLNRGGGFAETVLVTLESDQRLTLSAGFADLDHDGALDIVLGNWSSGVEKLFSPEFSGNEILYREGDAYRVQALEEVKGETNSVLLADIDDDGVTDLLIGNDRVVPDVYYRGIAGGGLARVSIEDSTIPLTSMFTMSLDAADFNNDLKTDLFSTDMTFARSTSGNYCAAADTESQSRCNELLIAYEQFTSGSAASCARRQSPSERQACYIAFSVKAAKELKDPQYCDNLPTPGSAIHSLCVYIASPIPPEEPINQDLFPQQVQRNVLLMGTDDGFLDRGREAGVDSSFWSWNAKAADLDNDEWQDIYVGNGFHFGDDFYEVQSNVLFHNLGGERFERSEAEWGLDDRINTPSYTYLDLDLDGDLDIISTGVLASPRVFRNMLRTNRSITFVLSDARGNSAAIGARVTIRYGGAQERFQQRDVDLSGGFLSFDNPLLHFGLGEFSEIDGILVRWPDGQRDDFPRPFPAGAFYRIIRGPAPGP